MPRTLPIPIKTEYPGVGTKYHFHPLPPETILRQFQCGVKFENHCHWYWNMHTTIGALVTTRIKSGVPLLLERNSWFLFTFSLLRSYKANLLFTQGTLKAHESLLWKVGLFYSNLFLLPLEKNSLWLR